VQVEAASLLEVRVSGLTDIPGRGLALLEVQASGPKEACRKLVLAEGQVAEGIELIQVDAFAGKARIRLGSVEKELALSGEANGRSRTR
jgi:hypothetical protein